MSIRGRVRDGLAGAPAYPALVLSGFYGIDQFDLAAVGVLGPEIVADYHTDAATFGYFLVPQLILTFLLPILFGYVADRHNRIRLTVAGGVLWCAGGFLGAVSPSIALFGMFRLVSTLARGFNVGHLSLLADYYPTRARGFAYATYNAANRLGYAIGLLAAGFLGEWYGWRVAMVALTVPGAILTLLCLRLREPRRGAIEAAEAGEETPPVNRPLGPIRASRLLLKTPTFKRLCWATAVAFAAIAGSGTALGFYFSSVFDVSPATRGVYDFLPLPVSLVTMYLGGGYGQRLMAEGRSDLVAKLSAVIMAAASVGFGLLAFAPSVFFAVLISVVVTAVTAFAAVPLNLLVAQLVPPHVRSQGFGLFSFFQFALTPIAILYGLPLGDRVGFRYTVLVFAPLLALAAALIWWASKTARRDVQRMQDITLAQSNARKRAASGIATDVLDVRGIDAGYGNVQILFGVDFHVAEGEIVALLGTNGAGKSTLLKVVSGLLTPSDGSVFLDGEDVTGLDAEVTASRGIIQVPGGRGVFPGLSVRRNLELGTYLYWDDRDYCERAVREVVELFPRLGERMEQLAGTLSGGEQQMLTLAQAFMSKPRIMMIDELSLGLAPVVVQELLVAVRQMNERGTSMVLVEQSVNIAMTLAHRAYFLEKGEVRFEGAASELLGRGDLLRSIFLEGAGTKMGVSG